MSKSKVLIKSESKTGPKSEKRRLTKQEIRDGLSFLEPSPFLTEEINNDIIGRIKNEYVEELKKILIYPEGIPALFATMKKMHFKSLMNPGESLGITCGQSVGEKQTQANLNAFHKAGSEKKTSVSRFSELLNATTKPKAPSFCIYFNDNNSNVKELRESIGSSLTEFRLESLMKDYEIMVNAQVESWYKPFMLLYGEEKQLEVCPGSKKSIYRSSINFEINMDILYEFRFTLEEIAIKLESQYADIVCIFSPDNIGRLDVFFETENLYLPQELADVIDESDVVDVYLSEVGLPTLKKIKLTGVSGIDTCFYLQKNGEWYVETENSTTKMKKANFTVKKTKPLDSTHRFKMVLGMDIVDATRTISNNIWDIYFALGIEAVRAYMIEELSELLQGINFCHVKLLVDKMTHNGTISSISRYSMRSGDVGPISQVCFEESLTNLLLAGIYCKKDEANGLSSSTILAKKGTYGTGFVNIAMDLDKLPPIAEEETDV